MLIVTNKMYNLTVTINDNVCFGVFVFYNPLFCSFEF